MPTSRRESIKRLIAPLRSSSRSRYRQAIKALDNERTSSTGAGVYQHRPLDTSNHEIRLLELNPVASGSTSGNRSSGAKQAPVVIMTTLIHTPLREAPEYVALSYTWGVPNKTHPLRVDSKEFPITKNLHEALVHLWTAGNTRYVWIDSICINQEDLVERASQVMRLAVIFRNAHEVIAWIGTHDEDSTFLFESIRRPVEELTSDKPSIAGAKLQTAFTEVAKRPYWSRVWVVQEYAVATRIRIMCGCDSIGSEVFSAFGDAYIERFGHATDPWMAPFLTLTKIRRWQQDMTTMGMLELLRFTASTHESNNRHLVSRIFQSTDIIDQIYGLLGLVHDGALFVPEPDYRLTMNELFKYMTKSAIKQLKRFEFALLESGESTIEGRHMDSKSTRLYEPQRLPSWCPDYLNLLNSWLNSELILSIHPSTGSNIKLDGCHCRHGVKSSCWDATKGSKLQNDEYFVDRGYPRIPGMLIGKIIPSSTWDERCASSMSQNDEYCDSSFAWLGELLCTYIGAPRPAEEDLIQTISYIFGNEGGIANCCDDLLQELRESLARASSQDDLASFVAKRLMTKLNVNWMSSDKKHWEAHSIAYSLSFNYQRFRRKLAAYDVKQTADQVLTAVEKYGAYAWIPAHARPGDQIWLLKGCSMPVVLRSTQHADYMDALTYIKVGPAVVNGAMWGSMWSTADLTMVGIV